MKEVTQFNKNRWQKDGLQGFCRPCQQHADRLYQKRHPERVKAKLKKRHHITLERNKAFVLAYLRAHPCVDCGESDVRVLEFDHVRGVKVRHVTKLLYQKRPLAIIAAEIEKCDVRCANCHRRKTFERRPCYRVAEAQSEVLERTDSS